MRFPVAAVLLGGVWTATALGQAAPPGPAIDDRAFVSLVDLVEENYFRETPRQTLLEGARDGMLASLDPYSRYLPPAEWAWLRRGLKAEFAGVGVLLEIDPASHRPRIQRLLVDSAAGDAGIAPGDVILAIDGRSTEGMTLDDVLLLLPGAAGSSVKVAIGRGPGPAKAFDRTLVRRVVRTPSVWAGRRDARGLWTDYLWDARDRIGYVKIGWLAEDTAARVDAAMRELTRGRLNGLVLDLRDNEGGLFRAAVEVSDLFLDSGRIVSETGRDGVEEVEDASPGGWTGFPMAVLVNARTMSSAEILASALQDNGRGAIIGERTFGKGLVQKLFPLGDGDRGIRLTVAAYRRASGGNVDRFTAPKGSDEWGVCPDPGLDVYVEPAQVASWTGDRREAAFLPTPLEVVTQGPLDERDPVLDVALEWLRKRIRNAAEKAGP